MSFGDNFLKGFFGSDYLKDYTHASKTFRANGYELAPRYKFLFHVRFNLNTEQIPQLGSLFPPGDQSNLSLVVKSVDLPSYTFDVETMNQYNRKRLVQKKVDYQPVNLVFHDDGSDLVRSMWYNYFSYYYKDPSHQYGNPAVTNGSAGESGNFVGTQGNYNARDTYDQNREVNDWGYVGESYSDGTGAVPTGGKPRFFNDIVIYGMNQHKYASYVLVNPIITDWRHDNYSYAELNGLMEHTMTIRYETVKYYSGAMSGQTPDQFVKGFADPAHYDTVKSPLARPGSTTSILGQGGVVDSVSGVVGSISDLATGKGNVASVLGAVQAAGRTYQSLKDKNLRSVIEEEANVVAKQVIRGELPGATQSAINAADGFFFGKTPGNNNPIADQPNTPKSTSTDPVGPVTTRTPGVIE